jgi:hypothetical protein
VTQDIRLSRISEPRFRPEGFESEIMSDMGLKIFQYPPSAEFHAEITTCGLEQLDHAGQPVQDQERTARARKARRGQLGEEQPVQKRQNRPARTENT